jgi:hypothetical protein
MMTAKMTWVQLRRQLWAIAGYFLPQVLASKALSAASPACASLARQRRGS